MVERFNGRVQREVLGITVTATRPGARWDGFSSAYNARRPARAGRALARREFVGGLPQDTSLANPGYRPPSDLAPYPRPCWSSSSPKDRLAARHQHYPATFYSVGRSCREMPAAEERDERAPADDLEGELERGWRPSGPAEAPGAAPLGAGLLKGLIPPGERKGVEADGGTHRAGRHPAAAPLRRGLPGPRHRWRTSWSGRDRLVGGPDAVLGRGRHRPGEQGRHSSRAAAYGGQLASGQRQALVSLARPGPRCRRRRLPVLPEDWCADAERRAVVWGGRGDALRPSGRCAGRDRPRASLVAAASAAVLRDASTAAAPRAPRRGHGAPACSFHMRSASCRTPKDYGRVSPLPCPRAQGAPGPAGKSPVPRPAEAVARDCAGRRRYRTSRGPPSQGRPRARFAALGSVRRRPDRPRGGGPLPGAEGGAYHRLRAPRAIRQTTHDPPPSPRPPHGGPVSLSP
jgi:hypothetical protein